MISVLSNRTYRHLLMAQIIALIGTGLATVAIGLLAYDIAGMNAGVVLGTALAIKMVAYIGIAPVAGAFSDRLPRQTSMVALDLVRAGVALCLPFVTEVRQVYILVFLLQSASAAFTPILQATIPEVLTDEAAYTRALSLARMAYDLESLLSPVLAALLLGIIGFHWLFAGTALGFVASALLIFSVILPKAVSQPRTDGIYDRITIGLRIYLKTPRLRGLLAVTFAAAAASAMVIVNTIVIIRHNFAMGQGAVALTLAAYGGGSMLAALVLPRVLGWTSQRTVMISGSVALSLVLYLLGATTGILLPSYWPALLSGWFILGVAYAATVTPSGLLLRRSAHPQDRPALFAAQFALSHICWLVSYPLAGLVGKAISQQAAFFCLGCLAALGALLAVFFWPSNDLEEVSHDHADLPASHPHLQPHAGHFPGSRHSHNYVIDGLHKRWPRR